MYYIVKSWGTIFGLKNLNIYYLAQISHTLFSQRGSVAQLFSLKPFLKVQLFLPIFLRSSGTQFLTYNNIFKGRPSVDTVVLILGTSPFKDQN